MTPSDRQEHRIPQDSRERRPWQVPDCPHCGGHVFVGRFQGSNEVGEWMCYAGWCDGLPFDGEIPQHRLRPVATDGGEPQ